MVNKSFLSLAALIGCFFGTCEFMCKGFCPFGLFLYILPTYDHLTSPLLLNLWLSQQTLFISITHRQEPQERQKIALRAVLLSAVVLGGFLVFGQFLLTALGVSLSAFQIGGGLVLLIVGLQMVLEQQQNNDPEKSATPIGDVAVFPLAIPFIAGPGAIMSVVLLTDNDKFGVPDQAITAGIMLGILGFTYLILMQSEGIQKLLGETGANIITRIIGLIVVAIAIQTMLTGIRNFFNLP